MTTRLIQITVSCKIEGAPPSDDTLQDIIERMLMEWPTWVYTYGDDEDAGALLVNLAAHEV